MRHRTRRRRRTSSGPRAAGSAASPATNATMAAPTPGAARSRPRPALSTCRMLSANTGSSATAPPNNTANRSSEIAPSTGFLLPRRTRNRRARCASAIPRVDLAPAPAARSMTMSTVTISSATRCAYATWMPKIGDQAADRRAARWSRSVNNSVFMEIAPGNRLLRHQVRDHGLAGRRPEARATPNKARCTNSEHDLGCCPTA